MNTSTIVYCCGCKKAVLPRLTNGKEIYPHRSDLASLPFWKCDSCNNYVGCHHKSSNKTKPLGSIPTKEIREARKDIHRLIDPCWKEDGMDRKQIYRMISEKSGKEFHSAEINSVEEADRIYDIAFETIHLIQIENVNRNHPIPRQA